MNRSLKTIFLMNSVLALAVSAQAQSPDSVYTSISAKNCKTL